jgi:hypothetical protein
MRNITKYCVLLVSAVLLSCPTIADSDDSKIFDAMKDELDRAMSELKIEGLEKPYYIEYTIKKNDYKQVKASLGSMIENQQAEGTTLTVGVRVGDYQFDQTNFFDINLSFFGSSDDEERYKNRQIPNELDYESLRRELWLATDVAYKHAAELYSKKESANTNRAKQDTIQNFLKSEVYGYAEALMDTPKFDVSKYSQLVKEVSAVFNSYDDIHSSTVGIEFIPKTIYYMNTEGTRYKKLEYYTGMEIIAYTKDSLGMPLYDYQTFYSNDPGDLPAADSIKRAAKNVADRLSSLISSEDLPEPYSGPILFVDEAAGELLAQGIGYNIVAQRKNQTEGNFGSSEMPYMALQNKVGARVVPEFLSFYNLTDIKDTLNSQVVGNYKVDDYGQSPDTDTLIKNGYLENLLSSRVPNRRIKQSSASKRSGGVMFATIAVENHEDSKSLGYEELKDSLIAIAAKRDLPYGIIVKKILNPNIQFTSLYGISRGEFEIVRGEGNFGNVLAYKVYPDGREELIKPTKTINFGIKSFKEILFTGDKPFVYNFLASAVESAYVTGGSQYLESTVITPSLLFEDCEIDVLNTDYKKPPVVPSPLSRN